MGDFLVCFDLDVDFCARFQLDLVSIAIDQSVRDANLAVQMIRTLDGDLGLFGFSAAGVRVYDFFNFSWKRSAGLSLFRRHDWDPPLNSTLTNLGNALMAQRAQLLVSA